ncbi:hypothetical protein KFK09_013328 [Dendrobium nobile]|uniref:Uncharacterized protein n=1 Tax=Dendrobium nobile TaxID=94219 RepID=A0A8T3B9U5_DENNO|nr:hypothetical protein KFK09_013328 [Dendrobium nobile]
MIRVANKQAEPSFGPFKFRLVCQKRAQARLESRRASRTPVQARAHLKNSRSSSVRVQFELV